MVTCSSHVAIYIVGVTTFNKVYRLCVHQHTKGPHLLRSDPLLTCPADGKASDSPIKALYDLKCIYNTILLMTSRQAEYAQECAQNMIST